MDLSENTINRLSIGLIEKFDYTPDEALQKLKTFRLLLKGGSMIAESVPLQAAFLTAINTGVRAFLGGVFIDLPNNVSCLLPWSGDKSLNQICNELGVQNATGDLSGVFTLSFGLPGDIDQNNLEVVANDWQGGVFANKEPSGNFCYGSLPLGGIYAGGLAIGLAFMKISKIQPQAADISVGLSLWRPDLHWLHEDAKGPNEYLLPERVWILGLGHLGQAYVWSLGLLPYSAPKNVQIFLQDFDKAVPANVSAGLLCNEFHAGIHKTRFCSSWLESRGIQTTIIERRFTAHTKREFEEPFIAMCGFDNAESRTLIEKAGFDFIVESGLGDDMHTFDNIIMHTFPSVFQSAENIWKESGVKPFKNEKVLSILKKDNKKVCGILEETIAGKAVSASFVGVCAGALAVSEILRGLNMGRKFDKIVSQLRFVDETSVSHSLHNYSTELAANGYQHAKIKSLLVREEV